MLEELKSIDPSILLGVVRRAQNDETFNITDWAVRVQSEQGNDSEGIFLFHGHGRGNNPTTQEDWRVVLKVVKDPGGVHNPGGFWSWRRELDVFQSNLFCDLAPGFVPQRTFGATEQDGYAWLWMELIEDASPVQWGLQHYTDAARRMGRFNGAYAVGKPIPGYTWFTADGPIPDESPGNTLAKPFVQACLSPQTRSRITQLWRDLPRLMSARSGLPRTLCHMDMNRRNLMYRSKDKASPDNPVVLFPSDRDELVAIDWAKVGLNAVGTELYALIGFSGFLCEWEPTDLYRLDAMTFETYMAGLHDVGWRGNLDLVRLAFTSQLGITFSLIAPMVIVNPDDEGSVKWATHLTGRTAQKFNDGVVALVEYALDKGDEALQLVKQLDLG